MKKFLLFLITVAIIAGTVAFLYSQNFNTDKGDAKPNTEANTEKDTTANEVNDTEETTTNKTSKPVIEVLYVNDECNISNSKQEVVFKNRRNIPYVICEKADVQEKINKCLSDSSSAEWYGDIISSSFYYLENTESGEGLGASLLYNNPMIIKNVFTIDRTLDGNFGGVSWIDTYMYNFNLENGELLHFDDVFNNNAETIEFLKNAIVDYYKNEFDINPEDEYGIFFDDWRDTFSEEVVQDGNWKLTEDGLIFVLRKYSIAPGASGTPTFTVSKEDANKVLKDEYKF